MGRRNLSLIRMCTRRRKRERNTINSNMTITMMKKSLRMMKKSKKGKNRKEDRLILEEAVESKEAIREEEAIKEVGLEQMFSKILEEIISKMKEPIRGIRIEGEEREVVEARIDSKIRQEEEMAEGREEIQEVLTEDREVGKEVVREEVVKK